MWRDRCKDRNLIQLCEYLLSAWQLSVANLNFESMLCSISVLSKLYTRRTFTCLCVNQQLRETLLTWSPLCVSITVSCLSQQVHLLCVRSLWQPLLHRYVSVCTCLCFHVCLLPHCTVHSTLNSRCFWRLLSSHTQWTRDKCQRVNMSTATRLSAEWLHLACITCHRQWQHTHLCTHTHIHISNESNPEIHTSPRGPRAVLSSYVNYCMQCALTWL